MRQKRIQIRDFKAESRLFVRRAIVSFFGIIVLIAVLLTNLYNIQINNFQNYKTRSNDNRIKVVPISPNRGLIYDRNGIILAENRPVFNLEVTPEKIKNIDETIVQLRKYLTITDQNIANFNRERKYSRRFKSVPLLTQINEQQVAIFSVNQHEFPGVEIKAYLKRYYPYSASLTHVLGYVSKINDRDIARLEREDKYGNYQATYDIGKLGIERFYEDELHGTTGYQEVEVNSRGRVIRTLKYVPPIPGKDLTLSLDITLQLFVEKQMNKRRGAAVILDPKDNGVLVMVSSPSYDPNLFVHGISTKAYNALLEDPDRPLVNRATLGIYPPASTIKPFMAVAALQEGVVTPYTTRNDPGYWQIPNSKTKPYRDWLRWGHGRVNLKQSIEESVDTFFYQIAFDMGIDRISTWMMKFGFGDYTGLDIREESKANMPTREWKMSRHQTPWYQGDTIPVGIGQGYWTATPMQLAKATSVLANHGKVIAPHLLLSFNDQGIETVVPPEAYPSIDGVKEKYWNLAIEGMTLVNHGKKGTARRAFYGTPYISAGKSGTAQVFGLKEDQEYNAEDLAEHLRDHALYTSFAPVKNPKAVFSIVLENAGGGSSQGAPIARKIFDHILLKKETDNESKQ
ncbi:MAG: penicillin-binding protein 2 [Aliivibrio sp.]|uniref:penicillin-binding protein 2 n=1 Tax=Aliivibrio sp. TaxID=1872443 RepID=UPI001A4AEE7B|nr:penicillin-binding protein 2 [Aliivibrio sp.]